MAPLRLNLGCGRDIREGYVNLDIRPMPGALQCDVSDPDQMMKYEGAVEILAYDILEHFDRVVARGALQLWVDLLAPNGTLRIRTPDLWRIIHHARERGATWLERHLYGDAGVQAHRTCFEGVELVTLLKLCGLSITGFSYDRAGNVLLTGRKEVA